MTVPTSSRLTDELTATILLKGLLLLPHFSELKYTVYCIAVTISTDTSIQYFQSWKVNSGNMTRQLGGLVKHFVVLLWRKMSLSVQCLVAVPASRIIRPFIFRPCKMPDARYKKGKQNLCITSRIFSRLSRLSRQTGYLVSDFPSCQISVKICIRFIYPVFSLLKLIIFYGHPLIQGSMASKNI